MGSIFISLWLRKLILLERSKDNRPYRLVVESAKVWIVRNKIVFILDFDFTRSNTQHVQKPFSSQTCDSKSNNSLKYVRVAALFAPVGFIQNKN